MTMNTTVMMPSSVTTVPGNSPIVWTISHMASRTDTPSIIRSAARPTATKPATMRRVIFTAAQKES